MITSYILHKISIIFVLVSSKILLTGNCKLSLRFFNQEKLDFIINKPQNKSPLSVHSRYRLEYCLDDLSSICPRCFGDSVLGCYGTAPDYLQSQIISELASPGWKIAGK